MAPEAFESEKLISESDLKNEFGYFSAFDL